LTELLAEYDALVTRGADPAEIARQRERIDAMAAQRDAYVSRLFWYTDLEQAKTAARASGRPILALRLLGHLDDDLSCANSRLFRLALYANLHVSQFLRDSYVLYWSSERPAPRMTVDFGDGRTITRTITGNSVHYVLDAQGRIVDALPGLYGPAAFERVLRESLELARTSASLSDADSASAVARYHAKATWRLTDAWRRDLARGYGDGYESYIKDAHLPSLPSTAWRDPLLSSLPASAVNALTESKADMEAPSLSLFQPEIEVVAAWGDWAKIAAKAPREHLDPQSTALIKSKRPRDWAAPSAIELDEAHFSTLLSRFEARITEEGIKNEYAFHGAVHAHLSRPSRVNLDSANDFIYARVFLTPRTDAWLGLTSPTALTGLEDDGLVVKDPG
jgi:hypothetical protein